MGVYKGYFRHSANLKRVLRDESGAPQLDKYGNPATSSPVPIRVFKTVSTIPIQTEAGTEYVQKNAYYVDGDVSLAEGDYIDNRRVDVLNPYYDTYGKLQYYVATVGV